MSPTNYFWIFTSLSVCSAETRDDSHSYHVTMHVFSGTPDPEWVFKPDSPGYLYLEQNLPDHSTKLGVRLGYTGFTIVEYRGSNNVSYAVVGTCSTQLFEGELLSVIKSLTPAGEKNPLSPGVIDYVAQQISEC